MEVVKKNILSILCGVVAIMALIALLWPLSGMYDTLQKKVDARKAEHTKLTGLLGSSRTQPTIELNSTEQKPLESFPGPKTVKEGDKLTAQVAAQSTRMLEEAVKMNRRGLLVPGSLPNPGDQAKYSFRDDYRKAVVGRIDSENPTRNVPSEIAAKILNATMPPTPEELELAEQQLWDDQFKSRIIYVNDKPANEDLIKNEYLKAIEDLPKQMRTARAREHMTYMGPDALSQSQSVLDNKAPARSAIWFAQNALWVQQDVAGAIAKVNTDAVGKLREDQQNVLHAPVKRVMSLQVPEGAAMYVLKATAVASGVEGGVEGEGDSASAAADPTAPVPTDFTLSPTGRVSNPLYDVVNFTLVVHMDASAMPILLQELSRDKFITVKQLNLSSVDTVAAAEEGFVYGPAPIVQLTLDGEALFLREWTTGLMPEDVKTMLGVAPPAGTESGGGESMASR